VADSSGTGVKQTKTLGLNKWVLSLHLKADSELAGMTECGSEFQVVGAVQRKTVWRNSSSGRTHTVAKHYANAQLSSGGPFCQ